MTIKNGRTRDKGHLRKQLINSHWNCENESSNHSWQSCYTWWLAVNRHYHVLRTKSMLSNYRDLHLKWFSTLLDKQLHVSSRVISDIKIAWNLWRMASHSKKLLKKTSHGGFSSSWKTKSPWTRFQVQPHDQRLLIYCLMQVWITYITFYEDLRWSEIF